jgi:hypothetical protein
LKDAARARGDRRFLRLLDGDEQAILRVLHDPVLEPEETRWRRWRDEDAARPVRSPDSRAPEPAR